MQVCIIIVFAVAATANSINWDKVVPIYMDPSEENCRIINGEEAVPNSIPWQAGLFNVKSEEIVTSCGGSIISNQWILTAAHCLEGVIGVIVKLGAHEVKNDEEPTQITLVSKEFIQHEDFKMPSFNDIGLVKLPESIEFNENIQPISLNSEPNVDDLEVIASGWGRISDESQSSKVLRVYTSSVMPNSKCKKHYDYLRDTNICIDSGVVVGEEGGKSCCKGDSGGPVVLDRQYQVGIVSFGKKTAGCEIGFPSVCTRVSSYIDWINNKIA